MKDELLQIFPTPILITKYEGSLVDELKHINTLDWIEQKANSNFKSKDTYLLEHKQFKNIKNYILAKKNILNHGCKNINLISIDDVYSNKIFHRMIGDTLKLDVDIRTNHICCLDSPL